jgi:hypothetical protein
MNNDKGELEGQIGGLTAELVDVQSFSDHWLRYLAQIPMPPDVFSTLLSLIVDIDVMRTDDETEIQSQ